MAEPEAVGIGSGPHRVAPPPPPPPAGPPPPPLGSPPPPRRRGGPRAPPPAPVPHPHVSAGAGRPVTVLEAAASPGGGVRTEALTLPAFHHDTFSSVYPAAAASPVFAAMPLARFGLEWVHPEACSAHPLPDGRAIALYRDLQRTAHSLDAAHAGDGDAWRAFVTPLLDAFEAVRATMLAGGPPPPRPVQ